MGTKVNTRIPKGKPRVGSKSGKAGSKGKAPVGEEWDDQPHSDPEDVPMLIKTAEDERSHRDLEQAFILAQKVFGVYNHG